VYTLVGLIRAVRPTVSSYLIAFEDDTATSHTFPISIPKLLTPASKVMDDFSCVEFEGDQSEGRPYFRLWVRAVGSGEEAKWLVERHERVSNYNLIAFHRLQLMEGLRRRG
jgi:hypothetical protein